MPTTARLGLVTPALSGAADVPADLLAHATALDALTDYRKTTAALRPANPGHEAVWHWATDTHKISFWDGAAWWDIGPNTVGTDTITANEIAANAVGSSELADNSVDTAAIQNLAVTNGKLATGAVDALIIAATLKPSGGAGAGTEALRALGLAAGTAMPGDQLMTAAQIANALKPSAGAADGTEALRALGVGAGQASPGYIGAQVRVRKTTNTGLSTGGANVAFDTEDADDWGGHAANDSRIFVPAAGRYMVHLHCPFSGATGTGAQWIRVRRYNAGAVLQEDVRLVQMSDSSGWNDSLAGSVIFQCAAGEYITGVVDGGATGSGGNAATVSMTVTRMS